MLNCKIFFYTTKSLSIVYTVYDTYQFALYCSFGTFCHSYADWRLPLDALFVIYGILQRILWFFIRSTHSFSATGLLFKSRIKTTCSSVWLFSCNSHLDARQAGNTCRVSSLVVFLTEIYVYQTFHFGHCGSNLYTFQSKRARSVPANNLRFLSLKIFRNQQVLPLNGTGRLPLFSPLLLMSFPLLVHSTCKMTISGFPI